MKLKKIIAMLLTCSLMIAFAACSDAPAEEKEDKNTKTTATEKKVIEAETKTEEPTDEEIPVFEENPVVVVTMESGETFEMELYPQYAPKTVANFVELVESGFYDGLTFHRVVDGFMAQGGDPEGTGMGGSDKKIKGEFAQNGFTQNTLSHTRGVVSMARSGHPDSASSQFFICYDDASFLDGAYAAFGEVIEGMEVVDGFLDVERTANEMGEAATPVTPIVIKTMKMKKSA